MSPAPSPTTLSIATQIPWVLKLALITIFAYTVQEVRTNFSTEIFTKNQSKQKLRILYEIKK
jgi:hypothetical protein